MSANQSPIVKGLSTQPPSTTKAGGAPTLKFGKGYIGGDSDDSKIVLPSTPAPTTNTNTKKKGKSHASKRLESADFKRHASLEKISVSSNSTRAPKSPSEAFQGSNSITDGMPVQNSSLVAPSNRHRKKMISNDDMYDYRPPSEQSSISTVASAEIEPEARIDDAKAAAASATASSSAAVLPVSLLMSPKSPSSGRDGNRHHLHADMPLQRGNSHMSTVDLGTVQDSPDSSDSELASTRRFPKPSFLEAPVTPGMRRTSITLDRSPVKSPQGSMIQHQHHQQQSSPPAPRRSARSLNYDGGGGPLSAAAPHQFVSNDGASQGGDSSVAVIASNSGTPSDRTYNNSEEFVLLASTQPRGGATVGGSVVVPMLALQQPTITTAVTHQSPPHTTPAAASGEELCHGKPTVRDLWVSSLSHPLSSLNTPTPVTTITHRLDDMWTQLFWTFIALLFMCPLCTDTVESDGSWKWWPQAIVIGVVGLLGIVSALIRLIPCCHIQSKPFAIFLLFEPWLLTLVVCVSLIVAPMYIFEVTQGVNGVIGRFQSNVTTDISSLSITDVFSGRSTHAFDTSRFEAHLWRQLLIALEVTVLFLQAILIERGRWQRSHNARLSHWAMEVLTGGAVSTPEIAATTLAARTTSVINRSASSLRQRYQATTTSGNSSPPEPPSLGSGIAPSSQHQLHQPSPTYYEEGALAFITDKESSLPSNPPTLLVYVPPLVVGCALTGVYLGVYGTDTAPLMGLICALWIVFPIISVVVQAVGVLLFSSPSPSSSLHHTHTRDRSKTVILTDPIPAKRPTKFAKKKYASRLPVAASSRFSSRPNERFSHSTFHPIVTGGDHPSIAPLDLASSVRRSEAHLMGFPSTTAAVPVRRRTLVSSIPSGSGNTPAIRRAASAGGGVADRDDTWVGRGFSRSFSPQRTHDHDESSFELSVGATPNDSPRRAVGSVNSPHLAPSLSSFARVQRATETNDYLYWSFQSPVSASLLQLPSGSTAPGESIRFGDSLNYQNAHGSPPSKFSTALSLRRFYPLLFPGALPADGLVESSVREGSVGCSPSSFCGLADAQLLAPLAPAAALQLAHMCLSHLPLLSPQVSPYTVPTMLLSVDDHSIVMDCNIPFASVFGIEDPSFLVGRSMHSVMEWLGADDVVAAQELLTDVAFMPSVMQCAESGIASSRMFLLRTTGNDGSPMNAGSGRDIDMPSFGDGEMEVSEALGLGTTGGRGAVFLEAWKFAGEDVGGRMSLIRNTPLVPALAPTAIGSSPTDVDNKIDKLDTGRTSSTAATTNATAVSVPSFVVLRQPMRHALVSHLPGVVCLANSATAVIEAWSSGAVEVTGLSCHDVLGRTMADVLGVSMVDIFSTSSTKMNSGGGEVSGDGDSGTGVKVLLLPFVGSGTLRRNDGRTEHMTVSITAWYPPGPSDTTTKSSAAMRNSRVSFADANGEDESASNRVMLLCTIALLDQQKPKELALSRGSSPTEPMVGVPVTTRLSRHDMSSASSAQPVPFMTPLSTGSYNAGSLRGMQRSSYRSQESSGSGNTANQQDLMLALSRIVRDFNSRRSSSGVGGVSGGGTSSKELLIQFADNTMLALQEAASRSLRRGTTDSNIPPPQHNSNRSLSLMDSNNSLIRRDMLLRRPSLGSTSVNPTSPNVMNRIWPPPGVKAIRAPNDAPMDPLVSQTSLIFADTPWAKLVSRDTQLCDSADVAMTLKQEFQFGRSNKCHLTITDTFVSSVQFGIVRKLVKVDVDYGGAFSPDGSKNKSSRSKRNSKVSSKTVVKVFLVDYSANGTYVNVKKIGKGKSVELSHSDLITFRLDNNRFFLGFKFELVEPFVATGVDLMGQSTISMENLLAPGQPSQQQISPRNPGAANNNNYPPLQPYNNNNDYHPYPEHPDYSLPGDGHGHMMGGGVGSVIEWKIGEEMIGKGGNAEVYLGMNITYGTLIAVKRVPLPKEMSGLRQYKALQEEIALLSNAQHPNIVQYYGSSQSDTHLNILLEFVPGGSLRHILDNFGNLAEGPIMRYLRQILAGLNYLHSIGIVHSDIKCANILVTEKGEVKLTDFGTAKPMKKEGDTSHDEEDKKGDSVVEETAAAAAAGEGEGGAEGGDAVMIVGTLLWMAPELCRAESSPSFSSDIWSLGCCLIEMFTAFYPWAEYEFESQEQIINLLTYTEEPPELPEPPSDTPQYRLLIDICSQCLSLDPNKRPTAAALLDTLYRFDQSQNPMMGRGGQVALPSRPATYPGMPPQPSPSATFPRGGGGGGQGYHNGEQWGNSGGSATSRTSMRSGVLPPARGRSPQSDMEEMNRMVSDIEAARSAIRRV